MAPLLRAIRDIAAVGSDFLPGFASGLGESTERFAQFIATARETGQLREWLSAGLSTLGDLAGVLGNVVRIVFTVLSAANTQGAGLLQTLNAVTGSMLAFLRSAEEGGPCNRSSAVWARWPRRCCRCSPKWYGWPPWSTDSDPTAHQSRSTTARGCGADDGRHTFRRCRGCRAPPIDQPRRYTTRTPIRGT
ncbi:hypothetical protein [Saccharothrix stipae]